MFVIVIQDIIIIQGIILGQVNLIKGVHVPNNDYYKLVITHVALVMGDHINPA